MNGERDPALVKKVNLLIESFMRLYDAMSTPSDEELAEVERRTRMLRGSYDPVKIAGSLIFFRMSRLLYEGKPLTMGELSEKLMIENYTATRLVSWWVKEGLAERLGDPNDRRIVKVVQTEMGRQFNEIIEDIIVRRVQKLQERLTPDEQIIFLRLFEKLTAG
jgi:DNA-binding MarR family transcriptional regulator